MTGAPAPRPLLPVLARMALGLSLAALGGLLAWQGVTFRPTPGLATVQTPLEVPLDGPGPGDLASSANLRFESDRSSIHLAPLRRQSPALLLGAASHRTRNPVSVSSERRGGQVNYVAGLYVKALDDQGVVVSGPEPYQHQLFARLSPRVPLTLSTATLGGDQTLELQTLRVRALTARSDSGRVRLTLPGRPGGPYAVISRSGSVTVSTVPGASPEALRINSVSGALKLDLSGASLGVLNAGSQSGAMRLTLPGWVGRASLTTLSGNVAVRVPRGARGNLDIRTQSGNVALDMPPGLRVRVRFTDRETLVLPPGTPSASAPQLDVFVDTTTGKFSLSGEAASVDPSARPGAHSTAQEAPDESKR